MRSSGPRDCEAVRSSGRRTGSTRSGTRASTSSTGGCAVADPVIEITRVFDAPRVRVWQEWTEPERFADWFGGPSSDVPLDSVVMDVQPGGAWRLTMFADPGRRRIDWHGEYLEGDEPAPPRFSVSDEAGAGPYAILA